MFDLGFGELMLILVAVLIFFGPKKLPELAQSLGRGVREFKKAQREFTNHINSAFEEEERRGQRSQQHPPSPSNTVARSPQVLTSGDEPAGDPVPQPPADQTTVAAEDNADQQQHN